MPSTRIFRGGIQSFLAGFLWWLMSLFLCISPSLAADPDFCSIPQNVSIANTIFTVTESCHIDGDLQIGKHGQLRVDYTNNPGAVFEVSGDILVSDNGALWIKSGTFQINQDHSEHRIMQTLGEATLMLEKVNVNTNPALAGKKTMYYNALNNSRMVVINCFLDKKNSWLLGNFYHNSQLIAVNSQNLPTEVYIRESATVGIAKGSSLGIWIEFGDGVEGTLDLPDQTNGGNTQVDYSWSVGRDEPGLTGIDWALEIFDSSVVLGILSRQGSSVTINGQGTSAPEHGELTIGYIIENDEQTLDGLPVGIQNIELGVDPADPTLAQLKLNDVNLGLLAWQIYAFHGAEVQVKNSILNEVGAFQGSQINVSDSHLQLAAVGAFGEGSEINISNSDVHSQSVLAQTGGHILIDTSNIYGSVMQTDEFDSGTGVLSVIDVNLGEFLPNGDPNEVCNLFDLSTVLFPDGTVICNPFVISGDQVTRSPEPTSSITCVETVVGAGLCDW